MTTPCVVDGVPTLSETRIGGVTYFICSDACRKRFTSRNEPRERVADWTTYIPSEHGLAGRRSEMYIQGVRVEVLYNTDRANHTTVFFLDDLRRDDVAELRALIETLRAARTDAPVSAQPQPSLLPLTVVFYPVETSAKWITTITRKLAEYPGAT